MTQKAKKGDKVKVHYTGRFENGNVFDSSTDREPLEVQIGTAQVIGGLDDALEGMEIGEKKTVEISPEKGYGQYDPTLMFEVPKNKFPDDINPIEGMQLRIENKEGQSIPVTVAEAKEESVQLDANHPLAGKELVFDIELVSIL